MRSANHLYRSLDYEPFTVIPFRFAERRPPTLPEGEGGEEAPASTIRKAIRQILIVEDEDLFRQGLALKLMSIYHAVIEEAETGWSAIEKVSASRSFDLILLDVSLPDMSGDEVYEAMRARGVAAPIVLMSAYEESRVVAQALGVPFLDKPLDDAALEKILLECGGEAVA